MKNISILDCTLRDGGRVINCEFSDDEIRDISRRLSDSNIDIVEVGFLRDSKKVHFEGNSTFFTDVNQIAPYLDKSSGNCMYVAFIDYGMFDFDTLGQCDGTSVDGIRVGFTKKDYYSSRDDIIRCLNIVKARGYKLFVQGVNSLSYSDKEMLDLVDLVNEVHPYRFGIVDTYGAMYEDDLQRIYALINNNMHKDICIDFHSHNNYQLSFSLAQSIIRLSDSVRHIIIDATLNGMGKVAGNLNTELIVDYMVRKLNCNYDFEQILDIIDDYIYPYKEKDFWGYSIPALIGGMYQSHPNNVLYLTNKFRLQTKDIKNLLSMIEPAKRTRYDYDNIERIYLEYSGNKIDDSATISKLTQELGQKEILLLVPGHSLVEYSEQINGYIAEHNPVCISVNFVSEYSNYAFWGNSKRYALRKNRRQGVTSIVTSNINSDNDTDMMVNYYSLIDRRYVNYENSTIMLLNLLKKIAPACITIAGFDGFNASRHNNYIDDSFQNDRHADDFEQLNNELRDMLSSYAGCMSDNCSVKSITPGIITDILK